ncbi:hypothetical protein LRS13_00260 [Svornostia abyssi]|uniref:Uncharacterized protein n=1 Tax=Svornostia abyssi TaxID=2898438 RepID=A0ABY5PHY6_9ACTN|nr:hypothetical protein LRS13_00260 [Parviterribacteraceae bacterium J379]
MTPDHPAPQPVVTGPAETHDDEIRTLVTRLSRPHRSGGRVIERAAVLAEGADFDAVMVWIEAHGGRPEMAKPPEGRSRSARAPPVRAGGRSGPVALRPSRRRTALSTKPQGQETAMSKPPAEPLRGDAAWQAAKNEIAKRNDAARARGAKERDAKAARAQAETRELARRELADLPSQPRT